MAYPSSWPVRHKMPQWLVMNNFGFISVQPKVSFQIEWGACGLIMAGNTVVFITIAMYFYFFTSDDPFDYNTW
jgi:hypothetical protein